MDNLSFATVNQAMTNWDKAKRSASFEQLGISIILRLFELEPETKEVFGFESCIKVDPANLRGMQRMAVLIHGTRITSMIDSVISAVGPCTDTMVEFLAELGSRHMRYGVKVEHFDVFQKALNDVLAEQMGETWTEDVKEAWEAVFGEVVAGITSSMKNEISICQARRLQLEKIAHAA